MLIEELEEKDQNKHFLILHVLQCIIHHPYTNLIVNQMMMIHCHSCLNHHYYQIKCSPFYLLFILFNLNLFFLQFIFFINLPKNYIDFFLVVSIKYKYLKSLFLIIDQLKHYFEMIVCHLWL